MTPPLGLARQHSFHCHYYPWKGSRCDHVGSTDLRAGCLLHRRSRLSRFYPPLWGPTIFSIFCDQNEKQFQVRASLFSTSRQIHRGSIRPNHCPRRFLFPQSLSRQTATDSLFRWGPKQTAGVLNQQLYPTGVDHCQIVSVSLAHRDLFQMDQTTPSDQSVLWDHRECRRDPNLDSNRRLRVSSHCQKTATFRPEPLHNSTDFERDVIRKDAHFRGLFNHSTPRIKGVPCNQLTLFD